ncbi:endonuclease/exonuclease/phosphatase family protein, partial [Nocardioides hankookensis]
MLPISSVRITQANLKSGEATPKFLSDLSKVFSNCPDFVTFNEVPYRADDLLAPTGYDLFRTPGQYTGASPVVWRTDRWTAINRGTTMISNKRGRERGQHVEWGIRYANWVTVRSNDGKQMVSMVATHIAPKNSITAKLMGPSIQRLGALVGGLSSMGPVFVGGDFNVHYRAKDYPRAGLTAAGLTPSYDVYGSYLPTGDHHGATIDYVFMRPAASFSVLEQATTELYSDHDALSVVLSMPATTSGQTPVSFAPGTSVNDPTSTSSASRRSVARTVRAAVHNTTSGAAIRLSTAQLSDRA